MFVCEMCEDRIPFLNHARLHSFCHNTPEILEGIRMHKSKLFQSMLEVSDKTISDVMKSSPLKNHIDEVSKIIEIPLEMHGVTKAMGNCWYEACASLMKLNKMEILSAKDLRKEVVNNIEKCENFKNVFEMIFESKYSEFKKFKANITRKGNLLMKTE